MIGETSNSFITNQMAADRTYERMEYEQRPRWVMCEICSVQATASQKELIDEGWVLDRYGEWCPTHRGS